MGTSTEWVQTAAANSIYITVEFSIDVFNEYRVNKSAPPCSDNKRRRLFALSNRGTRSAAKRLHAKFN